MIQDNASSSNSATTAPSGPSAMAVNEAAVAESVDEEDEDADAGDEGEEEDELELDGDDEEEEEEGLVDEEESVDGGAMAGEVQQAGQEEIENTIIHSNFNPYAGIEEAQSVAQLHITTAMNNIHLLSNMPEQPLINLDDEPDIPATTTNGSPRLSPLLSAILNGTQSPGVMTPLTPSVTRPGSSAGSVAATPIVQDLLLLDPIESWDLITGSASLL